MSKKRNLIEAIYPLSSMQQGMLFHSLYSDAEGIYNIQIECTLQGELDIPLFERAWQQVADRHAAFRTAFVWEHDAEPVQVVHRQVRLPWVVEDLRECSPSEQEARLATFRTTNRCDGFKLLQAPLMRLALFRLASDSYRFIWSYHHVLLDGWSLPIVLNEVFRCYDAYMRGDELRLAHPRPYRDYIAWLRRQDIAKAEAFWRQALAGLRAATRLGVGHAPEEQAGAPDHAERRVRLSQALTAALQAMARQHSLTLNTLAQAAWALLLSHYSGEYDVIFGVTVAGRPPELAGVEGMVGLFINTLPMRVRLAPGTPLLACLSDIRARQAELHQYEYSPLMHVQGWSEIPRGQPLFESIVVFENYPVESAVRPADQRPRLLIRDLHGEDRNNYPLTLAVGPGQQLGLQLVYDRRRFAAVTVARMLDHLQTLLAEMVADPARRLGDLRLLTAAERQQLLVEWNDTTTEVRRQESGVRIAHPVCDHLTSDSWLLTPDSWCIHELFEAQAARLPDAVALVFEGPATNDQRPTTNEWRLHVTYAELDRRANRVARYLRELGVGAEVLVAIFMERSLELIVSMLAVLKAGGAYVPLDPAYPQARLAFMLEDSQAALILTHDQAADRLPASWMPIISLDSDSALIAQMSPANPGAPVLAAQLAYVIYTSGSTGTPKGVAVAHRGLANMTTAQIHMFATGPGQCVLQYAALGFDAAVSEIFMALAAGATLCLRPAEALLPGPDMVRLLDERQITTVTLPPTVLAALPIAKLPRLQTLIVAGESCPAELATRWAPGRRLFNAYGPTEATVCATIAKPRAYAAQPPIGRPIANIHAYVLDAYGQPAPIGVVGELYLGGVGLARGYLGRPDLTAERFVPNPFSRESGVRSQESEDERRTTNDESNHLVTSSSCHLVRAGARLYKTGDLARYWPDGELEFLGRADQQLKLRGFRVEPGEIEAVLAQHPAVRECAVVAREDQPGELRLVAYVVPAEGTGGRGQGTGVLGLPRDDEGRRTKDESFDLPFVVRRSSFVSELRSFLAARLPDYMLPATFVFLETLPLTPHGKRDRGALPPPGSLRPGLEPSFVAPRTPIEQLLAQIWAELLRLEPVGVHEHFFNLGGHSLLATQLISRIRETFQVELPIAGLFEAPTIARLAERITLLREGAAEQPVPPPQPAPRDAPLPLSYAQQRLWFIDQLTPLSPVYNVPTVLRLSGSLNRSALIHALTTIVARHEVLRTSFVLYDGQPTQQIAPLDTVPLPLLNLEGLPLARREALARRLASDEARRPFDLARGPLLRIVLLRLAARDHVLLLTLHHIVADGWSVGVFCRELAALYAATVQGIPAALPDLPIQYADYAVWQRQWLQGSLLERQLAYWRQQLASLPVLELPAEHPRPATPTFRGALHAFALPYELSARLQSLSRREDTTLFMALLAAFMVLLARYSDQDDIVIGTDIANRTHAEIERLIGFFVNQLVLRGDLSGNPTFRELLPRVRKVALAAYMHQDLPFEQLVAELQPERRLDRTPLFQVKFILQNAPVDSLSLPQLALEPLVVDEIMAQFDLVLSVEQRESELAGILSYSTDLFAASTIARMSKHLETLLEGIVAQPEQRIGALSLLSRAERQQLLMEWNDTASGGRSQESEPGSGFTDVCLHHLVEAQVARAPDAVACVAMNDEDRTLRQPEESFIVQISYAELDARANQLARYLQGLGVGTDTVVALYLERSPELLVGLLGILKAGGAYVPLDPAYPAARLDYIIENSRATMIVTHGRLADELTAPWSIAIRLDEDWDLIAQEPAIAPESQVRPDNLAYVIYTSGSTGQPKGVEVPHRGLSNLATAQVRIFGVCSSSRLLQFAALGFDAAIAEIAVVLVSGATLVLPAPGATLLGADLAKLLWRQHVTAVACSPSALSSLTPQQTPTVRTVISVGEACSADLVARWSTGRRFFNGYGPTEGTICACVAACAADGRTPAIGRPFRNVQVYLLDRQSQPLPIGIPGELYIGGVGVARGYLGRSDLTAERFVPNPFVNCRLQIADCRLADSSICNLQSAICNRLYRTGDLARYRLDGQVEYLGRIDQQIKLRGYRIEVGEVEAVLRQHPAVRECVLLLRADTPGDDRLVAYIVQKSGVRSQEAEYPASETLIADPRSLIPELRSFLKERLPDYMLPAAFVLLEQLPLTPNGKVDRRALPAPDSAHATPETAYVAPRSQVEELLAEIWADVLNLARIGIHDNFFEAGGHSLLATRAILRAQDAFAVELPLRSLFEAPTIAGLAGQIEAARYVAPQLLAPPLRAAARIAPPLSFAQQRLWFLDQLQPGSPVYNMPMALRLRGLLDVAALARSLSELIRRHEALRTTFALGDGLPIQVIATSQALRLRIIDLRPLPQSQHEAEALRLATAEAERPFDLTRGPLLRVTLLRSTAEEHALLLTIHHIVSDGWSMGVIIRELSALYSAYAAGQPTPLLELPIQYADFALWQRQWLQGEVLEAHLAYWRRQLADLPPLDLPTDRPRSPSSAFQGASERRMIARALRDELLALSRHESVTPFMALLAAFQLLLSRYSGQDDVAVGTPIANRPSSEVEGLVGFFINTLVLRSDLSGDPTFRELAKRVRETCLGAYAHQDLPFERLVEELQPVRDLTRTPLFQVMFNMVTFDVANSPIALPGLTTEFLPVATAGSKFDLTLYVRESDAGIQLELVYNTDLFTQGRARELLEQFHDLLRQLVRQPDARIGSFSLVTASAAQYLPNPTQALGCEWSGPVHAQFSRQAGRLFGRPAVVDGRAAWSYQDLDARSSQLANYLRARGIRSQDTVAIYAHRSAALVWALLGVLKAGAAFSILDPAYPAAWLADCLNAARPRGWIQLEAAGSPPDLIAELAASLPCQVVLPEDPYAGARGELGGYSTEAPAVSVGPDDLAYIAFTSGSSGRPKGILGTHRPLAHFLTWYQQIFALDEADRFSMLSGLAYDPLLRDIFTPLWLGATLHIPPPDVTADPGRLARWMDQARISVAHLTPALGRLLTDPAMIDPTAGEQHTTLRSLRYALFGGDVLTRRDIFRLRQRAPSATCVNVYGATETPQVVGYYVVPQSEEGATDAEAEQLQETIPIGQGIEGAQLLVLNAAQRLAGVGELGEIAVRTAYLSQGYVGDERLTGERFICNPFAQNPSDRLYKTGDLGRYLPGGDVTLCGRSDQQVKIRGFRIEPSSVAAVLAQHPAVREAVVLARASTTTAGGYPEQRLVAYVVPLQGTGDKGQGTEASRLRKGDERRTTNDERRTIVEDKKLKIEDSDADLSRPLSSILYPLSSELREFVAARLPAHMVPAAFVLMPVLPLTPNGKVDYRALPDPDDGETLPSDDSEPRNWAEERLAEIWAGVLRRERVGIHDNFFALGGDSIKGIQVIARANRAGLQLTPKQLFQHQTIAELAAAAGISANAGSEQGLVVGPVALTPAQCRLLEQAPLDSRDRCQALLLETRQSLAPGLTAQTIRQLLAHHDALRLRFTRDDAGWRQVNAASDERIPFTWVNLAALPEARQQTAIEALAAGLAAGFDLAAGPLLHIAAVDLGSDRSSRMLIVVHRFVSDSDSWGVLLEDFQQAYAQLQQNTAVALPPKTTSFRQWAERLATHAQSPALQQELDYWLAESWQQAGHVPLDYPAGASANAAVRDLSVWLGAEETHALLHEVPRAYHTRLADVLLTALTQALSRWMGRCPVLIDVEQGREQYFKDIDLSRTIGCCTTVFPVRLEVGSDDDPGAALKRVKEQLRAVPSQGISYGLLRYLNPDPASSERLCAMPQAEISFTYLGQIDTPLRDSALFRPALENIDFTRGPRASRRYLLEVRSSILNRRLRLDWIYDERLHRRSTISQLAEESAASLRALIEHCLAPEAGGYTPSDFPKLRLSQEELDDLVAELSEESEE